jgi:hypothetical protein
MKPCAKIDPEDPTVPAAGVSPVAEALTAKVVGEVAVFAAASVTVRISAPLGTAGMVKMTVEAPLVPAVPPEVIVAALPSTSTLSAEFAAKPWAKIHAEDPTVPEAGLGPLADALSTATELLALLVADHERHTAVTV